MTQENLESLTEKTLDILHENFEDEKLKDAWALVFAKLAVCLNLDHIMNEAIPRISPLYGVDKSLDTRVRAAKMLISVIKAKSA